MLPPLNKTVFSVLALFFIAVAAFTSLESFRGYRAEITVLVLPLAGSEASAEQMVENIALLPTTVSFFDDLLASDARLTEFSSLDEQPINARREEWSDMLSMKREGGSGVITYTIEADTQEEATVFARKMSQVLFQKVGTYYDIRSDVSLRLIEGPLVRASLVSPVTWILLSLLIGVLIAIALMMFGHFFHALLTASSPKTLPASESKAFVPRATDSGFPPLHPDTFVPKKPAVFFSEESEARAREEKREYNPYVITPSPESIATQEKPAEAISPVVPSVPADLPVAVPEEAWREEQKGPAKAVATPPMPTSKAQAPSNLPFIDEATFLAQFSSAPAQESDSARESEGNEEISALTSPAPVSALPEETRAALPTEPTMEDYRRRLNELLKEGK